MKRITAIESRHVDRMTFLLTPIEVAQGRHGAAFCILVACSVGIRQRRLAKGERIENETNLPPRRGEL
jgi:hypothetical protein